MTLMGRETLERHTDIHFCAIEIMAPDGNPRQAPPLQRRSSVASPRENPARTYAPRRHRPDMRETHRNESNQRPESKAASRASPQALRAKGSRGHGVEIWLARQAGSSPHGRAPQTLGRSFGPGTHTRVAAMAPQDALARAGAFHAPARAKNGACRVPIAASGSGVLPVERQAENDLLFRPAAKTFPVLRREVKVERLQHVGTRQSKPPPERIRLPSSRQSKPGMRRADHSSAKHRQPILGLNLQPRLRDVAAFATTIPAIVSRLIVVSIPPDAATPATREMDTMVPRHYRI